MSHPNLLGQPRPIGQLNPIGQEDRSAELTIAVIAKECLPGKAKTRLSPPLSPAQAAGLAQSSLSQTLRTVRTLPARHRLLVFEGTPLATDAAGFEVVPQRSGGLDERLAGICAIVPGPLLILGMDTPQADAAALAPMFVDWSAAEPAHDAWLGPADDGGFWALALSVPDPELLRGVPMSTGWTGRAQLDRLESAGLTVGKLVALRDMDYFSDAQHVAEQCPGSDFARQVELLSRGLLDPAGALR